ncbi:MAG: membrane protein insertion efficiency factor YidD [Planctomycetes bacterium]|nr:membrane protein insertion efficiency factor YidD [Planctomycetota bacterium]
MKWLLLLPVWLYRRLVSPWKPPTCRFRPTCSAYALEALQQHGALHGAWLTARRLCRCHPFHEPGFDPVPQPRRRDPAAPAPPAPAP